MPWGKRGEGGRVAAGGVGLACSISCTLRLLHATPDLQWPCHAPGGALLCIAGANSSQCKSAQNLCPDNSPFSKTCTAAVCGAGAVCKTKSTCSGKHCWGTVVCPAGGCKKGSGGWLLPGWQLTRGQLAGSCLAMRHPRTMQHCWRV